ncbi:ion transport protein [Chloropicon primus]|uniref:Ion transport protein n=1 Tax=Chloropicon primus TaxID=1764295 RepID=A0A5B8MGY8_9CHLO|nr:ion transport protein [Chloropicon primus]UPQ98553.1 ion transport protein [Chloropicon primus]|eukprot:QDZ19344.1 ion transport protein [Chloropicon primus]
MFFNQATRGGRSPNVRGDEEEAKDCINAGEGGDENLESSSRQDSAGLGTPTPTTSVKLKLQTIMQRAMSELPDSPHNKVCESYGEQFPIFLRFKGKTKMVTWSRFDTKVDLQNHFFKVFNFPESVLHAFLLNKARMYFIPQRRTKTGKMVEEAPELLSVLSQVYPGVIIEAQSDVWEAWHKHARSGQLVRRFSLDGQNYEKKRSFTTKMNDVLNEPASSQMSFVVSLFINSLIFLSSVIFVVETLPVVKDQESVKGVLKSIETVCVAAFTVELIARFIVTENQGKFVRNVMNIVDFIAILPFYIDLFSSETLVPGLSILRLMRLARVLRLFKVMKTFISVLSGTVSNSSTPLGMLIFFLSITTILYSSVLYYAERGTYDEEVDVWRRRVGFLCPYLCLQEDPYLNCEYKGQVVDVFSTISVGKLKDDCVAVYQQSPFDSIVSTFWVVCQTMTVVGYGDTEILSPLGKFIGTCSVLTGILALALPISIIETNFSREMVSFRKKSLYLQIQKTIRKALNVKKETI